ncbi:MAG: hypothetical protein IKQ29_00445, partial [Bacilli bacterium]|nr:hypothetical protein [Bacilli bacterium]
MEKTMIMTMKFTCIGKGHGAPCLPANRAEWEALRRESWLAQMCARIEKGDNELKHRLPVWTPHCAEFKDNHRAIADAIKPLNRLMLDFDEKGHTDEICARLMEKSPLVPLLIEESVRRGTHVLVELPDGMTPEEAQELMKEATGFEPDAAVKDVSRCIYMVTEEHTKYVSDKLFEVSEECERKIAPTSNEGCELKNQPTSEAEQESNPGLMFKGIPYTSIISEWWRRNGGEPQEGERNVKLHKLAVNLRAICDNKREVLMQVMPRFGLTDAELRSVVDSACKEEPKGISKVMQGIIDALELGIPADEIEDAEAVQEETGVKVNVKALPIGLKESLVGVPVSMHMPVLCGIMPICGAYADGVEVEYCDGNVHRLGLMAISHGEQASNKSVVKNAIDVWK